MFKIAEERTYRWPVQVEIPADGGTFTKATFDVEFKALAQARIDEYIAGRLEQESDLLRECVVGWKGVADDAGNEVPFSEEAAKRLFGIPYVRSAIVRAYFGSLTGSKRKN